MKTIVAITLILVAVLIGRVFDQRELNRTRNTIAELAGMVQAKSDEVDRLSDKLRWQHEAIDSMVRNSKTQSDVTQSIIDAIHRLQSDIREIRKQ